MKWIKRILAGLALLVLALAIAAWLGLPRINGYKKDGSLTLDGPISNITISRDEKGMAYVRADSLEDALFGQGFATAQDRLFQMQLTRMLAQGRIAELAGEPARSLDIRMRTIGIRRLAEKQAAILDDEVKNLCQRYLDGVNAFIQNCPQDIHLEFKLAGIKPETWALEDCLSLVYYMGWITSANMTNEILGQMLVEKLGLARAREIFPLNINPDDPETAAKYEEGRTGPTAALNLLNDERLMDLFQKPLPSLGSNNWVVSPRLAGTKKPLVAGDPHLDARLLPGVWHPIGLITPEIRVVGANIAGIPGITLGRTQYTAFSMTNAYADVQDLYIETLDPEDPHNYLEGERSIPFEILREKMKIKDVEAPGGFREEDLEIKLTRRGPVVSGVLPDLKTDKVITLRWAAAESMSPKLGLLNLMTDKTVAEVKKSLASTSMMILNYVFADVRGDIGWLVSGKVPVRTPGSGTLPQEVAGGEDDWTGWIPEQDMPQAVNPEKGWIGTCNHKTTPRDYPYYYSNYFSSSYRYRRLKELMAEPGVKDVQANWKFQRDEMNPEARLIAPIMVQALSARDETKNIADLLGNWDYIENPENTAPTVWHAVYERFARLVYEDELGPELTGLMLNNWYFWQERLGQMVIDGDSPWFDNIATKDRRETLSDLFVQAGREAWAGLSRDYGDDPGDWTWGKLHTILFLNPIRRSGPGMTWLGSGPHAMGGSGETLYRARYSYGHPFDIKYSASLRMAADLGDEEKVLAVLPGGAAGRTFDPPSKRPDRVFYEWGQGVLVVQRPGHQRARKA